MELINEFLRNQTLMAEFWIASPDKEILSFSNEGISVEKSTTYLKKYFIHVYIKKLFYKELEEWQMKGWQDRHPKVIITRGNGEVEAYDKLRQIEVKETDKHMIIKFAGEKIDEWN